MRKLLVALLLLGASAAHAQERLTPELLWKLGRVADPQVSPDGSLVVYGVTFYDVAANRGNTDLYVVPANGGEPRKITTFAGSEFNARWRPDGKRIGFLSGEGGSVQLWEVNPDGSDARKISDIEGGIGNFLYSPKMSHVSFTRDVKLDTTAAEKHPDLPKTTGRVMDGLFFRHWNAWHDYAFSHVFVAPYSDGRVTGAPTDLMPGERFDAPLTPFGGVEQIAWSPDGGRIAYTSRKLSGTEEAVSTNSDIFVYDLATRRTTNISEGMAGYDVEPRFSPDGRYVAWLSMERPGFEADRNRIFLYDTQSSSKRELSEGFTQDVAHLGWSPDGSTLYFVSGKDATLQLYSLDLRARSARPPIRQITNGMHDYLSFEVAGPGRGRFLVAAKQSMSMPTEVFRVDPATGKETQLTFTNRSLLANVKMGRVERRMVPATDGKQILTWVIYPPDFNPSRKYPAILYAQGGPQTNLSQFFSYRWNFQLMAANDYIVIAPNRRGVLGLGQEWTDQISGDWGGQAMQDMLSANDALAKEPFVDEDRMGAAGASFGGFTVFWLAGNHNKRFKALLAHAGVFNFESMYGSTEEMWFATWDMGGPYWQNPTPRSYVRDSPHRYVQNWDTPILIVHGELDYRVPVTQGFEAFTAAQLRGVPSRFLYFPDEGHWILKPQNGLLWQRTFFEWFDKYLKSDTKATNE